MGFLGKVKGIFYDEVVVEEPEEEIKKVDKIVTRPRVEEPRIEKIKNDIEEELERKREEPKKEVEKPTSSFNERDLFRNERTFNFVDFDDDEEEEPLPPKKNILDKEVRIQNNVDIKTSVPEQRVFKPTPVISPIYGILDKDYKKEEIKQKTEDSVSDPMKIKVTNYDNVRRKAYGTLEDELENTLNTITTDKISIELKKGLKEEPNELKRETKTSRIEKLINQIDDATDELDKTMSIGELEDSIELENFSDEEEYTNKKDSLENTLEHDLFNLIDSMYDKED